MFICSFYLNKTHIAGYRGISQSQRRKIKEEIFLGKQIQVRNEEKMENWVVGRFHQDISEIGERYQKTCSPGMLSDCLKE